MVPHFAPVFFFNDTATTEIYTLSLHDALPICCSATSRASSSMRRNPAFRILCCDRSSASDKIDRKSTRLNSSHSQISYAVFCLKKKRRTNDYESSSATSESTTATRSPCETSPT